MVVIARVNGCALLSVRVLVNPASTAGLQKLWPASVSSEQLQQDKTSHG